MLLIPACTKLPIPSPILPPQRKALRRTQHKDQQTSPGTNPHALAIKRPLALGKNIRAEHRPALAKSSTDGQSARALRIGGVHVGDPDQHAGDADEDHDGEEHGEIAHAGAGSRGLDDVADGGDEAEGRDEGPTDAGLVRDPGDEDDGEKAEEVGWGGQAL